MANKKISELQLISAVTSGVMLPGDDGLQTYRLTAAQLKAFILAAGNVELSALDDDIFNGLSVVSIADDDYLVIADTSDSNKNKKALAGAFVRAGYRSVTTTDAVTTSDSTMKLSGSSFTSTLPTAVGIAGKRYKYIHAGTSLTQVYTIQTTSSQTIGGVAGGSYALYTNGEVLEIESDGANWIIMGRYAQTAWTDAGVIGLTAAGGGLAKGTTSRDKFWYKRIGDHLECKIEYAQSATGTAGSGDYLFALPSNMTIDTNKVNVTAATWANAQQLNIVGACSVTNSGAAGKAGQVVVYDSTKVRFVSEDTGVSSQWAVIGSGFFGVGGTAIRYTAYFNVPMANWQP